MNFFAANDDLTFAVAVVGNGADRRLTKFDVHHRMIWGRVSRSAVFHLGMERRTLTMIPDLALRNDLLAAFRGNNPEIEFIA